MSELESFEVRVTTAVHAFADRAETEVDAVAVAARAISRRRTGMLAVLGHPVPVPASFLVVSALLLAFGAWSLTGDGPVPVHVSLGPGATPTVAPTPTPAPTPTIAPMAPAYVTGTGSTTRVAAGTTTVDNAGIAHTLGVALAVVSDMSDPRVTGTGTYRLGVDTSGQLGFAAGTLLLENAHGSWAGTCTGATRYDLTTGDLSCWLVGSGAYQGLTYYISHHIAATGKDALTGVVLEGSPPSP